MTKTKPSHYQTGAKATVAKTQWPITFEGGRLATEVRDSASCTTEVKARMIRDIIEHEDSHGNCTQTFLKKVRRQLRPSV